jgi:S1-C subfamily serine protease
MSGFERIRSIVAVVLLGAALAGAPASAQVSTGRVERTAPPGGGVRVQALASRPSLGFVVDMRAGATDSIGARIESVTPGGPADRAGIRSGDIVTRFAGRSLLEYPAIRVSPRSDPRSAPAVRLIIQSVQLAPNDTVALQLRRGTSIRNVRVVTEPQRTVTYWRQPATVPDNQVMMELEQRFDLMQSREPLVAEARGELHPSYYLMSPLASLQLAPLNAELGEYFGISDGILVISVPKSSGLQLRGGDVILRVDGRTPASPIHLLRILQSYDSREEVRLDIVRNRKRETLEGTLARR